MVLGSNLLHPDPKNRLEIYHDPLLDELVRVIQASGIPFVDIAEGGKVSAQTIGRWCAKEVHSPRLPGVRRVLDFLGYDLQIIQKAGATWN